MVHFFDKNQEKGGKTEQWFFAKTTFRKKINSQTFFAILLIFFSMHKKYEKGGCPKSGQTDLLSTQSTQN